LLKKARDSLRGAKLLAEDELYDFAASRAYYIQSAFSNWLNGSLPYATASDGRDISNCPIK
jgi:hypothetical protein